MNPETRTSTSVMSPYRTILFVVVAHLACSVAQGQTNMSDAERERKAKEAFIEGTSLQLQGGHHAEAILEFQESLRFDTSAVTLTAMARSYLELGKIDRAEEHVRLALEVDSKYRDAWETLSEILVASGKYDEGVAAYEHVVQLNPTRRQLYTLARLYEPRDAKRAAELYELYVRQSPDADTYMRLAALYRRLHQDASRILTLEKAYGLDTNNQRIQAELVEAYVIAARFPDAVALARSDRSGRYRVNDAGEMWTFMLSTIAGDSALVVDYPDNILNILDQTLTIYHDNYGALVTAGELALRVQDLMRAKQLLETAALQVPQYSSAEPLLRIAVCYLISEHPSEALEFATQYQPRYSADPRFLVIMADASVALEHQTRAIDYYRAALDLDPLQVDVWIQLGIQTDNAGRTKESDHAYREALKLDPTNIIACNNFAYSLALRNTELETAKELAWRAVQQQPTNPAYLDTYAWVLYRTGDAERAKSYMEQAVRFGGNATHYEHLGDILEQLGEHDLAVVAWRRALESDPSRTYLNQKIDQYR